MKKLVGLSITDTHLDDKNIDVNISIYKQVAEIALKNNILVIQHLGDIFNKRKGLPDYLINVFNEILDDYKSKNLTLSAIKGNHDCTDYAGEISSLLAFKHHPAFSLIETVGQIAWSEDITMHLIPFYRESDTYQKYLDMCLEQNDFDYKFNFLGTHIAIDKAQNNDGSLVEGLAHSLFDKFDKVIIGHYHDENQVSDKMWYCGSSLQHNFGETVHKGCVGYYDDGTCEIIPLDFPKYIKHEVNIEDLTPQKIVELSKEAEGVDKIRVVLKGESSKMKAFDKSILEDVGVDCKLNSDKVEEKYVVDEYSNHSAASIKEDFEEFCKENNYDLSIGLKYLNSAL